jgi:hypothetical protein
MSNVRRHLPTIMHVEVRPISKDDASRIFAACAGRVAQYKLKRVWTEAFETYPLPGQHTGKACVDSTMNALFTQVPYHWQEMEGEKYIALIGEGVAVWREEPGFKYALVYCSQSLVGRLPFLQEFAAASLRATGSWKLPTGIEPSEFYCEAAALTL